MQAMQRGTYYSMDQFKSILDPTVNPQLMCKHCFSSRERLQRIIEDKAENNSQKKKFFAITFTLCVNKSTPEDNNSIIQTNMII